MMKLLAIATIVAGVLLGVCVGIAGTGGAFVIPLLVYLFHMGQLKAQGTALLIAVTPIYIFPFLPYYKASHYELKTAVLLAIGMAIGGYLGAVLAQHLPQAYVRKVFAVVLVVLAVKMFTER
jgi:uncharacterized protein